MNTLTLPMQSSSAPDVHYLLTVRAGNEPRLACTCPAAENGLLCKHVLAVLEGDASQLAAHCDTATWQQARELIASTGLQEHYSAYQARAKALEKQIDALKKEQRGLKRALARDIITGAA